MESLDLAPERQHDSAAAGDATGDPVRELHVLVLIDHLVLGGAEMLLTQFASAAPLAGIRVSVACLEELDGNPAAGPLRQAGVNPINLNAGGRPGLGALARVRSHLAQLRPDIVHTHLGDSDVLGTLAARSLGIPAVCTIHTVVWEDDLKTRVRRSVVKRCAARVVAVSDTARSFYADRGFSRNGQLVTIHNGIDVSAAPGAGETIRSELGWARDDLVVGMVSALRAIKSHDVAIDAISRLLGQFPNLRLLIVGNGPAWNNVSSMASKLGDRVAMVGRQADVMRYYDAFDVCLHPSRAEAFPTTLIEAMAAGVPVVATAVGGIPEIVEDGRTGVLIPAPPRAETVAEALASLLGDRDRREGLGHAGRETYESRFTAGPWIRATRAIYDAVLAERQQRRTR